MQLKRRIPVGKTNYKSICRNNYYVDKTLLIKEIIDEAQNTEVMLFTRPRRFGKTLNMNMLQTFFEKTNEDTSVYFADKKIWQQGDAYKKMQGQYPVIFLTLKDIKFSDWSISLGLLKEVIRNEYSRHQELESSQEIAKADAVLYHKIINDTATDVSYFFSLQSLSRMLYMHHKKAPIIIIDEYDTPIQQGFIHGYYQQAVDFIRNFFSSALKDNPHMSFAILTGILRVAKESIFSGLNNLSTYSVLDDRFSEYFGFTNEEVTALANYYNAAEKLPEIKEWYDGYQFGKHEIYNPWSVANYFNRDFTARPYWTETSENSVVHKLLQRPDNTTYENLKNLLSGSCIQSVVKTNIIYPSLNDPQTDVFGFLLMTGYLKATELGIGERNSYICKLEIPNKEREGIYWDEVLRVQEESVGEDTILQLQAAFLTKDCKALQGALGNYLLKTTSFYDGLNENYYHGLLLGLMAVLIKSHKPLSNRESGYGRYDIELVPKNSSTPGIIIELKAAKSAQENLQMLAEAALEQIEQKRYDTALFAEGVNDIYKYGIAFYKKNVEIVVK